jgi:hypothetical protein
MDAPKLALRLVYRIDRPSGNDQSFAAAMGYPYIDNDPESGSMMDPKNDQVRLGRFCSNAKRKGPAIWVGVSPHGRYRVVYLEEGARQKPRKLLG